MKTAVNEKPVAIAVMAGQTAFRNYGGGIAEGCLGNRLDHGIVLAGWGVSNGIEYWIARNSWGARWGEQGYIRIRIEDGLNRNCGLLQDADVVDVVKK
jgi:hypothetical protein